MLKKLPNELICYNLGDFLLLELLPADLASQIGESVCQGPERSCYLLSCSICDFLKVDEEISVLRVENPVGDDGLYRNFFIFFQKIDEGQSLMKEALVIVEDLDEGE
jgi:hypothetical protein